MKKVGLIGGIVVALMILMAILTAGEMGETSPAFARGSIVLDDSLIRAAEGIATLYISISDTERPRPPFGALRKSVRAPLKGEIYKFALTYDNVMRMQPEAVWPKVFNIKARLDRDGRGGPDQPGDLVGVAQAVQRGVKGLEIRINKKVK